MALAAVLLLLSGIAALAQTRPGAATQSAPAASEAGRAARFAAIDVVIDSGSSPLAAYQFELTFKEKGAARIVGVEGGDHAAFADAPYYDPAALHDGGRIIIADYSTADALPAGQTRVARVHVQLLAEPMPAPGVELIVAGAVDGSPIQANITAKYTAGE